MQYLRQSTASQEVALGYFVDSTDGNTEETVLTIANTDIKIWKTGATTLANKNSGGATHISNGIYYAVLDATDTDTIGPLRIFVHVSGALPVILNCVVLDEAVYDVLFGTTAIYTGTPPTAAAIADAVWDEAQADHVAAGSFGETATEIADILTDTADMQPKLGTPSGASMSADIAAVKVDTAAILVDTGTSGVLVATGAIGSTQFAAGAIDAAAIAADAIGSSELAATAAEEIADTILLRKLDRSGNGTDLSNERTVVNALRALRNKQSIAAGTLTVTKENDTDTAWTASIATTAGDPISSIDPA